MKLSLSEHIQRSKEAVAANKAKGNKHAELFANMYTQPSRFIEEILQNTEDAYTRKKSTDSRCSVRFKLFEDKIEIHHNGKNFDENDLMSITTFANTTKKNNGELNLIGKFGIGFKSVFSITDFPEIHCCDYHFKITDFEVFTSCTAKKPDSGFNTLIILPFKKSDKEKCFSIVQQGLKDLNDFNILFLKKLNVIEVYFENQKHISIERNLILLKKNIEKRIIKIHEFAQELSEKTETYLVYSIDGKQKRQMPELAFKVIENLNTYDFKPIADAPLFVYFPLKMFSGLNFLIHAPFTTNPLRDFTLFDDENAPENIQMLDEAVNSFVLALSELKKLGLYSVDFLANLYFKPADIESPDKQKYIIQQKFYLAFKKFLSTTKSIPIEKNKFTGVDEVLIPQDEAIYKLLQKTDLQKLFQKDYFMDSAICSEKMTDFRDFLINELNISSVDAESFGFRIKVNSDFFENRSHRWLSEFYKYLHTQQKLWDVQHSMMYYSLRNAPIIFTSKNAFEAAYDQEQNPKVFLSCRKKDKLTLVNQKLYCDENFKRFVEDLEIKKPNDLDDVLYNIIVQFENENIPTSKEYFQRLDKIISTYHEASKSRKEVLLDKLKKTNWVLAKNHSGEESFCIPEMVYIKNGLLNSYFKTCSDIWFFNPAIYSKLNKKYPDIFNRFLKETGLADFPRIQFINDNEFEIDGFDDFILYPDFERSNAFLKILLTAPEKYFLPQVLQYLKKQSWLLNKNNNFVSPESIHASNISRKYKLNANELNKLFLLLGIDNNSKPKEDIYLPWEPAIKPEDIILENFINLEKSQNEFEIDFGMLNSIQTSLKFFEPNEIELRKYSTLDLEKIQNWSISFILRALKHEFPEPEFIIEISPTADFIITKAENIFRYVFISSKSALMNNYQFSVEQFKNICKLLENQEQTYLYCVDSVGSSDASVQIVSNPFSMFVEDKIKVLGNLFINPK